MAHSFDIPDLACEAAIPSAHQAPPEPGAGCAPAPGCRLKRIPDLASMRRMGWLQRPEIPERGLVVLYGPSGTGKSFLALYYALRLCQDHPVVYVASEGSEAYAERVQAWCALNRPEREQFYFWDETVNMLSLPDVDAFIQEILPVRPALVTIDTLARCMLGGDENSTRDMGLFIAACDRVRQATGAAIMLVHHTGKSGTGERGSSALRCAADVMLELRNDDGLLTVSCTKSKRTEVFPVRRYRLVNVETGCLDEDGRPVISCAVRPVGRQGPERGLPKSSHMILEVLATEPFLHTGASSAALSLELDLRPATLYRQLAALTAAGHIRRERRGHPYFITEAGKAVLGLARSDPGPGS